MGKILYCVYGEALSRYAQILLPIIFMESSEIPLRIKICCPNDILFEKRVF